MKFWLKHKNDVAALLDINEISGKIVHAEIIHQEFMPFLGTMDIQKLRQWWQIRGIPERRKNHNELLEKECCSTSGQFMIKNLALSVSDTYWICPVENADLTWEEVNVFQNKKFDPNATLNASSVAKWVCTNGTWKLYKEDEHNGQESINERFATLLHSRQDKVQFTSYDRYCEDGKSGSVCDAFTTTNVELIHAYEVALSRKQNNDMSDYEHYIRVCVELGLNECYVREIMNYMILTDFLLSNVDRHYCNFGVLRDAETLKVIGMAPLYDFGNSMFYAGGIKGTRASLLETKITGMAKTEEKMLRYVSNPWVVKLAATPEPKAVREFYINHGIATEHAGMIAHNYQLKQEMICDLQKGKRISLYLEMWSKRI